jgi:hypothetical protein
MPAELKKPRHPVTKDSSTSTPLISESTILILSGILIGIMSTRASYSPLSASTFLTGITGLIAYYSLGYVRQRKAERAEAAAFERSTTQLAQRVERHIPQPGHARKRRFIDRASEFDRQYVTVVSKRSQARG